MLGVSLATITVFFICGTVWTMDIDKQIACLTEKKINLEKELKAGGRGDSTMAYRFASKLVKPELDKINEQIEHWENKKKDKAGKSKL